MLLPLLPSFGGGGALSCGSPPAPTAVATPVPGPATSVRFVVDTGSARRRISPYVYGVNQTDWSGRRSSVRAARLGGNRWTAYNWENNASNAGTDFRNQNDDFLGGGDTPGEAVRTAVAQAHAHGAAMIVTVPMAGYVAADKSPGGDVAQTPDYLSARFRPTAFKGGRFVYPPDPADEVVYEDEFVDWLEATFPAAHTDASRAIFYELDNEPDLWAFTHPRVRPTGKVTYDELAARTIATASAIKSVAPQALVFGPASYGWNGFVSLQDAPDRRGRDFLDFYLDSMRNAELRGGRRLLDVLDLHWYPEAKGGGVRITEASTAAEVVAARVQAPRSLWDPSYVETSWISQDAGIGAIRLLPRMTEKVAAHYPGTRLAFTEWSYGGGNDVSGAIAHADVLGIFGAGGVFAATVWNAGASPYVDAAFDAYCNYDGQGSRFGDTAVTATTADPSLTSIYASVDEGNDDHMVLVAINKSVGPVDAELAITHATDFVRGSSFCLTGGTPRLVPAADPSLAGHNLFRVALPAMSVTTVVLRSR